MSSQPDFRDARWRKLRDAEAADEPLDAFDQEFLASYQPRGEAERAEAELMGALERLGSGRSADDGHDPQHTQDDAALLDRLVGDYCDSGPEADVDARGSQSPLRRNLTIAALGAAAAVAVAAVAFGVTAPSAPTEAPVVAELERPSPGPGDADVSDAHQPRQAPAPHGDPDVAGHDSGFVLASGAFERPVGSDTGALAWGTHRASGGSEDTCLTYAQTEVCLEAGSTVRLGEDDGTALELVDGAITITADQTVERTFAIVVAGTRYEAREPTVTHLSFARRDSAASVTVERGSIARFDGDQRTQVTAMAEPPRTKEKPTDAKTLLLEARTKRAAGDTAGATRAYASFLEHYPKAPAAAPSMVTLAELYLSQGRAKLALKWFDRYIKRGGTLDEEARYGAIRALQVMGRRADARKRADDFRTRYPSSGYAPKLP